MTITKGNRKPVRACLFDMDGLLINSEEIYTQVTNEILKEHGKPELPFSVKATLQGLPGPAASKKFLEWSKLPYTPEELYKLTSLRQESLWNQVIPMPGAEALLKDLQAADFPIALATSSHRRNFEMKTGHLQHIFSLFGPHIVVGDDSRIPPGRGKPAPDIWHVALSSLNDQRRKSGLDEIAAEDCLVFEDGVPGVTAGKAAGCQVIWVPDPRVFKEVAHKEDEILGDQVERLSSLENLDFAKYGLPTSRHV